MWLARVVDPESPGEFLGQIVAKIIQPSLLRHPNPDSYYQWNYIPPNRLAYAEDQMYGNLQALQGCEALYFYGVQTVRLHSLFS